MVLDSLQEIHGDAGYCFAQWAQAKKGGALKKQKLSVAARDAMLKWIGDSMGDEAVAILKRPLASLLQTRRLTS